MGDKSLQYNTFMQKVRVETQTEIKITKIAKVVEV